MIGSCADSLAIPLILCLAAGLRRRSAVATAGFWAALVLSVAELAMIAGAGHAIAGTGWTGDLHLVGDGVHLLAAGAWIGGLLPLALLFAAARRDDGSACALAARDATSRFSLVGILAVVHDPRHRHPQQRLSRGQHPGAARHRLRPFADGEDRALPHHGHLCGDQSAMAAAATGRGDERRLRQRGGTSCGSCSAIR